MNFLKKLWKCLFVWNVPSGNQEELERADVIVTQAISRSKNGKPGCGNELLAMVARQLHRKYPDTPIIPQEEVWLAEKSIPYFAVAHVPDGEPWDHSTPTWNTESVARFQAEICRKNGWIRAALIAVPVHQGRAAWTMEKLGLEPIVIKMPGVTNDYCHNEAAYWSARAGWRVVVREFFCRLYFLFTGRI